MEASMTDNQKEPETQPDNQNTEQTVEPKIDPVERSKFFLDELDKRCKAEGVVTAVVIIIDPKLPNPILYAIGDKVATAVAACDAARILKRKLITSEELSV